MKKYLNVVSIILALGLVLAACGQGQFNLYKETFHELTENPKNRKIKGNESDVNDLKECPVLFKTDKWRLEKLGTEKANNVRYTWGREWSWYDKGIISEGGVGMVSGDKGSFKILNLKEREIFTDKGKFSYYTRKYLIYVGPWRDVLFTYPTIGFFSNPKIEIKKIRAFAYQDLTKQVLGDRLVESERTYLEYEEFNSENQKIPEQRFALKSSIVPGRIDICRIKWTAKYGYNAVADLHPNPWFPFFTREYLTGSGKIIDSETGEVIADEKGNLVKSEQ